MLHTPDGKGPWRHSIVSGAPAPSPNLYARLAAALQRLFGRPARIRSRG